VRKSSFPWFTDSPTESEQMRVDDIIARVVRQHHEQEQAAPEQAPRAAQADMPTVEVPVVRPRSSMWLAVGIADHHAPQGPISVQEAHRYLQQHRECQIDECDRKAAAWRVLVEEGKIRPDSSRDR
jgi:hypothetical protein